MKKVLLWFLGIILGFILAAVITVFCIWGGEIRTVNSLASVDGNPFLFQMEYKAAYDLDDVISKDVDTNAEHHGEHFQREGIGHRFWRPVQPIGCKARPRV